jgi:hypothetical protein
MAHTAMGASQVPPRVNENSLPSMHTAHTVYYESLAYDHVSAAEGTTQDQRGAV